MRINRINKYISTFETKKKKYIFYQNDLEAVAIKDKFKVYTTEEFYKKNTVKEIINERSIKYKLIIIDDLSSIM